MANWLSNESFLMAVGSEEGLQTSSLIWWNVPTSPISVGTTSFSGSSHSPNPVTGF